MLERLRERLKSPKAKLAIAGAVLALVPLAAQAFDPIGTFWSIIAAVFEFGVKLMGFIMITLVKLLISVAQYQNFVAPGPTAVRLGWVVTRDLANMFFIFILLIIAFGTIVGYEEYHYRSRLPRLLLMAIVINFSKTICGIFIDMGQVIMLTFVNGFAQAAGGNFLNAFQVNKLLQLRAQGDLSGPGLALGMALAFVMVSIATNVILVMLIMLTFRIVYLWVLIVLSPIAFLASAFPPAASYYGKWWSMFRQYITSGPIVAFFLWLALISVQQGGGDIAKSDGFLANTTAASTAEQQQQISSNTGIPTEAASDDAIMSLIVVTAILMAGLKVAKELDASSVGMANWIKGKARGIASTAGKFALRTTGGAALSVGGRAVSMVGRIPYVGAPLRGIGNAMQVQGSRLTPKLQAGKLRQAIAGTPEEQAKADPRSFSLALAREKNPARQAAMAKAISDPDVAKRLAKDPKAAGNVANALDGARKTNPSLDKSYKDFVKANWKSGGLSDAQKKDAFGAFGADDAAKLSAGDIEKNKDAIGSMSSEGFNQLLTKGTQEQKQAMEKALADPAVVPDGAQKLLAKKKVDPTALSADAMEHVSGAADYALERGRKDNDKMDEMMRDDRKAAAMRTAAGNAFNKHDTPSSDLTIDSIRTGAIDAGQLNAETPAGEALREKVGNSVNPSDMLKRLNMNDPKQREAGQAAWGAFEKANPQRAQKLADTGNYNDFIKSGEGIAVGAGAKPAAPAAAAAAPASAPAPAREPAPAPADIQGVVKSLQDRLGQLKVQIEAPGNPFAGRNQEESNKLTSAMQQLTEAVKQRDAKVAERDSAASGGAGVDTSKLEDELGDLNKSINKMLRDLKT